MTRFSSFVLSPHLFLHGVLAPTDLLVGNFGAYFKYRRNLGLGELQGNWDSRWCMNLPLFDNPQCTGPHNHVNHFVASGTANKNSQLCSFINSSRVLSLLAFIVQNCHWTTWKYLHMQHVWLELSTPYLNFISRPHPPFPPSPTTHCCSPHSLSSILAVIFHSIPSALPASFYHNTTGNTVRVRWSSDP